MPGRLFAKCMVVLWLGGLATVAGAIDEVALLIDTSLYGAGNVSTKLARYEQEVEERFPVQLTIHVDTFESWSPEQIRTFLQNEYTTNGIAGAVLVGQMPYIVWRQDPNFGSNQGALAFFYEDLDGEFLDQDGDGKYDYHTWGVNDGPEIWTCWMRPPVFDEVNLLEQLLDEAHDYYVGDFVTAKRGFVACHGDYDNNFWGGTIPSMPPLVELYGGDQVPTDGEGSDPVVASDIESRMSTEKYEIVHFWSHANSSVQAWDSGWTYSSEVWNYGAGNGPLITHIYGCHSGDFIGHEGTSVSNITIAIAYAFSAGGGQASSGTSWSYGTEAMCAISDQMADGAYLGAAWKHLLDTRENSVAIQQRYGDRDVHKELSGNNLFGNPFLYANYTGEPVQDCNGNGVADYVDIRDGYSQDCNENGVPDECDILDGTSADCNGNGVPDECDIADGTSGDCNGNGVPDECDIADGTSGDCNATGVPDECEIADGSSPDCNGNGVPDECDVVAGTSGDCNGNGIPDECDVMPGLPLMTADPAPVLGWTDISGSGTATGLADEGAVQVTMPFTPEWLAAPQVMIHNNGGVGFGDSMILNRTNRALPSSMAFAGAEALFPMWDDLDSDTGDVYYATVGTAPHRTFIVQWHDRPHYPGDAILDGDEVTFQVQIYETPVDHVIAQYVYADVDFDYWVYDNGASATVGYQSGGAHCSEWSYNGSSSVTVVAPLSLQYEPPVSEDLDGDGVPDECQGGYEPGDLNCDGAVDVFDINPFVTAILDPADYAAQFPGCELLLADINGDSQVDVFDINPFVDLVLGN